MQNPQTRTAIKAHQRSYDNPLVLSSGDRVRIIKSELWEGQHLWLWCAGPTGTEGWVPEAYLLLDGEAGTSTRDYSTHELTVIEGQRLLVLDEQSGWYWCETAAGERGWVPVSCFAAAE